MVDKRSTSVSDWFYDILTIVGYLMPNPFNRYILNIYDLVWLWQSIQRQDLLSSQCKTTETSKKKKSGIADHIWKEKGNHLPLWDKVKIINREEHWKRRHLKEVAHMLGHVDWFGWFYGISTFVGYLMPNPFLCKLSVLLKTVQFSVSTQFNCQKHFHFKLFKQLYVIIQLSVNTVLMSKNSSIRKNSVKHKHAV